MQLVRKTLRNHKLIVLALGFAWQGLFADPFSSSFDLGTSISHSYDARNILINPAAMAYDQELNGSALQSSYTFGRTHDKRDQLSFTLGYGPLGIGWEKLTSGSSEFSRFSLGAGVALTHQIFFGMRYSFTNSDIVSLSGIQSLDLSLQYRPIKWASVGFAINRMNHPTIVGVKSPAQYVLGATIRPISLIDLSADIATPSDSFGDTLTYQGIVAIRPTDGIEVFGGYQNDWKGHFGIRLAFGRTTLHSEYQPSSFNVGENSMATFGLQTSILPRASFMEGETAFATEINGSLSEAPSSGGWFSKKNTSLVELLSSLEDAATRNSIRSVMINLEIFPLGPAAAQEVQEALLKIRKAGKTVEVSLGEAGITEYLIASAANRINISPNGFLRFIGARSERFYAKGTLDKLGIEGQFLARGEYKSAPELFLRKEASPESKEATWHELKEFEREIIATIAKGRKFSEEDYKKATKQAIFSGQTALAAKLVDSIEDHRTAIERIEKTYAVRETIHLQRDDLALPSRISVIVASGNILNSKHRLLSLSGQEQITTDSMVEQLDEAASDPRTKAIVLRISSGGGEVLASHEIANSVRKVQEKKPVYVSMGDAAASGGYMIAAPATQIFAKSLTATGSIGVFLGKFSLAKLYQKLDLNKEILSNAPYPGLFSESRPWTPDERAIMKRQLDQYYEGFVDFVATSRKMKRTEAEAAAKGRVWLGKDALKLHLVDREGGVLDAITYATDQAGVSRQDIEIVELKPYEGFFPMLSMGFGARASTSLSDEFLQSLFDKKMVEDMSLMTSLSQKPFLFWQPGWRRTIEVQ